MPTPRWIRDLFEALDQERIDAFCEYLDSNCKFIFGNADPVEGKSAIRDAVGSFYRGIEGSDHRILETFTAPSRCIVRGEVTYTERTETERTVPFANVFELERDLITTYQIYVDNHRLNLGDT